MRQQLIVWLVAGSVLVVAGIWTTLFPLRAKLQAQAARIQDAQVTLELNSRQQQNLSSLKNQVDQILKNSEVLNDAFFDRSKTLDFLEYIEGLAEKEQLELAEPQLTAPARVSTETATTYSLEEKPFNFDLQGPVPNLMRFLRTLEQHPSYILITTVSLQKGAVSQESSLTIEGVIPWH